MANEQDGHVGRVVQIIGPVVDVEFSDNYLPPIYQALRISSEGFGGETSTSQTESTIRVVHLVSPAIPATAAGPTAAATAATAATMAAVPVTGFDRRVAFGTIRGWTRRVARVAKAEGIDCRKRAASHVGIGIEVRTEPVNREGVGANESHQSW